VAKMKAKFNINVGARIRAMRIDKGLSVNDLAEFCGLSPITIKTIENGNRGLSVHSLISISNCLGVTMTEVALGEEE